MWDAAATKCVANRLINNYDIVDTTPDVINSPDATNGGAWAMILDLLGHVANTHI